MVTSVPCRFTAAPSVDLARSTPSRTASASGGNRTCGGPVGQSVIILGNGLTGSTSVTFNGVDAEFTVESDTYIEATVPADATTGTVSVVTQSGTLNSNPQFVVSR